MEVGSCDLLCHLPRSAPGGIGNDPTRCLPSLGWFFAFVWASIRFASRSLRDAVSSCVLFKVAKIPVGGTFLAKRVHGSGVSSTHCYRLPVAAVKTCAEIFLYQALVNAHIQFRRAELTEPFHRYDEFISDVLSPFGCRWKQQAKSPSNIGSHIVSKIQRENQQMPVAISFDDNKGSMWRALSKRILEANPDSKQASRMGNLESTRVDRIGISAVEDYELKVQEQVRCYAGSPQFYCSAPTV